MSKTELVAPFSWVISGPSKAGKTEFALRVVRNLHKLSGVNFEQIYFCVREWQPAYTQISIEYPHINFTEELPPLETFRSDPSTPKLLLIDDMMDKHKQLGIDHLFTRGSHHWNLSLVYMVQNLYCSGTRTSRINASYLTLFKNPGDTVQIHTLARQMYPGNSEYLLSAFRDATALPFGYLFVNLTQQCPDDHRLRTCIFPEETEIFYLPQKSLL